MFCRRGVYFQEVVLCANRFLQQPNRRVFWSMSLFRKWTEIPYTRRLKVVASSPAYTVVPPTLVNMLSTASTETTTIIKMRKTVEMYMEADGRLCWALKGTAEWRKSGKIRKQNVTDLNCFWTERKKKSVQPWNAQSSASVDAIF